jgi:hypothetical protein
MAVALGSTLSDALFERLSGRDPGRHRGLVLPFCTVDAGGWPHVALLSYTEVVARDASTLRVALYADSGSAENLRRGGRATLLIFDAGLAQYIKLHAAELPQQRIAATPWNAVFELRVEQVLSDAADPQREGGSVITSGTSFEPDPAHDVMRAAVLAALRSAD